MISYPIIKKAYETAQEMKLSNRVRGYKDPETYIYSIEVTPRSVKFHLKLEDALDWYRLLKAENATFNTDYVRFSTQEGTNILKAHWEFAAPFKDRMLSPEGDKDLELRVVTIADIDEIKKLISHWTDSAIKKQCTSDHEPTIDELWVELFDISNNRKWVLDSWPITVLLASQMLHKDPLEGENRPKKSAVIIRTKRKGEKKK